MPKQALNLKFFRDISRDTKRIKDNPESSQGTFLHFTCNYILKDNQISEQEPEHNCLLPPWHIPCESRVHLPLASLWPQDLDSWLSNNSAAPGRPSGAPAGTSGGSAAVTHGWEAGEVGLNLLRGEPANSSHLLADCSKQQLLCKV